MKREKITDFNKIETLYKEGKISRATYWRAQKRGWIYFNYHTPEDLGGVKFDEETTKFFYSICRQYAGEFYNLHKERILNTATEKSIIHDLAGDVFTYVISKNPVDLKQACIIAKFQVRNFAGRGKKWYCKYMFVPQDKQHYYISKQKEKEFKEL